MCGDILKTLVFFYYVLFQLLREKYNLVMRQCSLCVITAYKEMEKQLILTTLTAENSTKA